MRNRARVTVAIGSYKLGAGRAVGTAQCRSVGDEKQRIYLVPPTLSGTGTPNGLVCGHADRLFKLSQPLRFRPNP